ncbi:hypothetical protein FACS189445_4860 [Spirochaetia bacterium]|nr:hypothetical protein FACS189445_4860 [Spirochaetia bacterium]
MEPYRPLRLIFFIYDFIRLVVMTSLLMAFLPPASSGVGGTFPHVFYAIPNSLFTLMSFFLWLRLDAYKPYIALYMAGKILAVVAIFTWLIVTAARLAYSGETFTIMGTVMLLAAGDAFTVLGGAVLKRRIRNLLALEEPTECA